MLVAAIVVLLVAGVAWIAWAALNSSPAVSAQLRDSRIESEHRVIVTLMVTRREGDAVQCQVYAQAADHSVVGESTFDVPAGEAGTVTVAHAITTEREAVVGVLRTCDVTTGVE